MYSLSNTKQCLCAVALVFCYVVRRVTAALFRKYHTAKGVYSLISITTCERGLFDHGATWVLVVCSLVVPCSGGTELLTPALHTSAVSLCMKAVG
jgi:hypothetical protein